MSTTAGTRTFAEAWATTVANAISFPRQESADGLVRAALGTHAGQDSSLTVVEAEELHADKIADPLARLVFRVHLPDQQSDFPSTGLQDMAPTVETAVSEADVGVSLREPPTRGCLLGARIGGEVTVWRLSRVQSEPGEASCDPETALQRAGLSRPQ